MTARKMAVLFLDLAFCRVYVLHVLTWHKGTQAKIIIKEREKKKVLHRISEFLQIFTRQIQALVYLWLEKPNIARVMHSQSFCVPYLFPGFTRQLVCLFIFLLFL